MASSWKVELIGTEDETPFKKSRLEDGKIYFHAEPGRCFHVKVTSIARETSLDKILVFLKIDGDDVGYSKRIHLSGGNRSAVFEGIYKMGKIYDFKFSDSQLAPSSEIYHPAVKETGASSEENSAGSIEVKIYEAFQDMNAEPTVFTPANKGLPSENKKIDKDKKFWAQPSVTTACADEGRPAKTYAPYRHWTTVSNVSLFTFTGYYHTPGVIKILQNVGKSSSSSSSSSSFSPDADNEVPMTPPLPVTQKREVEVIDLTGDQRDENPNSSSKKRRRSNQFLPIIII